MYKKNPESKRNETKHFEFECTIFSNGNENNKCFFISEMATDEHKTKIELFPFDFGGVFFFGYSSMVFLIFFITLK